MIRSNMVMVASALLFPLLASASFADQAGDNRADSDERRCLSISHIRRIEILDDSTLYFHMRGGQFDYLNHLPHRCPGLKSHGTFMHSTSTSNYCDLDVITVVDTSLGMRLASCPLGRFEAVERDGGAEGGQE